MVRRCYPFGWEMPGRKTVGNGEYRYGFNGKEDDRSWGAQNIQDYGFRLYNPSIGKFLSVDPLSPNYPMLTPYQFAHNRPIVAIDLDGLEADDTNPDMTESTPTQENQSGDTAHGDTNTIKLEDLFSSDDSPLSDYKYIERSTDPTTTNPEYIYYKAKMVDGKIEYDEWAPTYYFPAVAWFAYNSNDNFLARRFLKHYTSGLGTTYTMTEFETKTYQKTSSDFFGNSNPKYYGPDVDSQPEKKSREKFKEKFKTMFGGRCIKCKAAFRY